MDQKTKLGGKAGKNFLLKTVWGFDLEQLLMEGEERTKVELRE